MRDAESSFRKLEDPVSADETRHYVAHGWAALLSEIRPPTYVNEPWSVAFEAWERAAYSCGFVPEDVPGGALVPWWRWLNRRPDRFRWLGLQAIRKWNHVMWRGFKWGGGGFVDEAIRRGATQAMLHRLAVISAYDELSTASVESFPPIPKADTYGGILVDDEGRFLLAEPAGHFGGYAWTFAKGRPGKGESPEQAALRKVLEKTGYQAEIFDVLPIAYEGDTSTTAYFLMAPVGDQGRFTTETAQTRWVSAEEAADLIARTTSAKGRDRDLAVLAAAQPAIIDPITYPPIQSSGRAAEHTAPLGNSSGLNIPDNVETSLQVVPTVEGLVRGFLADALDLRRRYLLGEITPEDATNGIGTLSTRMQVIFYGEDPTYQGTDWNTPQRLGQWLTGQAAAITPPANDAVYRLFNKLMIEVGGPLNAADEGTMSEDMIPVVIEEAIARYTAHLLGMPPEFLAGTSS